MAKDAKSIRTIVILQNILVVAHGAILYAIVTAITNGRIAYGGKAVKFDPGSIHLIRYLDGVIEFEKYNT